MRILPTLDRDAVRAGFDALAARPEVAVDHVRFRRDLVESQWAMLDRHPDPADPRDEAPMRFALSALRERLAAGGRDTRLPDRVIRDVAGDPAARTAWLDASLADPNGGALASLSARLDVPAEALAFLGGIVAAPFAYVRARSRAANDHPEAVAGRCFACGALPGLALITPPDGRRVLCCGSCGARWEQPRLACPGCRSSGAMTALRVPDVPDVRVESCDTCRGALVTVDLRPRVSSEAPVLPLVERTAALAMDLLIEQDGLTILHPYCAML
ncbi:MAG TPA: formate dehydrogenase accessory protein FdhE [Myxococcota bacterium]|nr:formate dehydrogenase accessory protein FdhE [Myxococcota bacterium]